MLLSRFATDCKRILCPAHDVHASRGERGMKPGQDCEMPVDSLSRHHSILGQCVGARGLFVSPPLADSNRSSEIINIHPRTFDKFLSESSRRSCNRNGRLKTALQFIDGKHP